MFRKKVRINDTAPDLAQIIHRNIDALASVRKSYEASKTPEEKIGDGIASFFGSFRFLQVQLVFFVFWILLNLVGSKRSIDPFPFPLLALITSALAFFMSVVVLVRQNRIAKINTRHADLDLQVSLLCEHEITRLIHMVESLIKHTGAPFKDNGLEELKADIEPTTLINRLEETELEK